jgi:hypothetical protein
VSKSKNVISSLGLQRFFAVCGLVFLLPFGHSLAQNIPSGPNAATKKDAPLLPSPPNTTQMPGNLGGGAAAAAAAKPVGVPISFVCSAQNEQISDLNKLVKLQKEEIARLEALVPVQKNNTSFNLQGGARK